MGLHRWAVAGRRGPYSALGDASDGLAGDEASSSEREKSGLHRGSGDDVVLRWVVCVEWALLTLTASIFIVTVEGKLDDTNKEPESPKGLDNRTVLRLIHSSPKLSP